MKRPLRSDAARALANLAIDLGDPGRMAKARRLYRSNAVATLEIDPGIVFGSIADAEGTFEVELKVIEPILEDTIPQPADLTVDCTCDDTADACRHGLATILALAEEVEIDVRTLARWATFPPGAHDTPIDVDMSGSDSDFFVGQWRSEPKAPHLPTLPPSEAQLIVDEVDAGPVVVDATRAIMRALKG